VAGADDLFNQRRRLRPDRADIGAGVLVTAAGNSLLLDSIFPGLMLPWPFFFLVDFPRP
jgi:hypothetical protein